jgi:hypothetical protein
VGGGRTSPLQDLCVLTNGEAPQYLGILSLQKTFGLELIESVLSHHHAVFLKVRPPPSTLSSACQAHTPSLTLVTS